MGGPFRVFLADRVETDPAHGMDHVRRVVANALQLAETEEARLEVVLACSLAARLRSRPQGVPRQIDCLHDGGPDGS